MFCTKCGNENKIGAKFCVKCGNELKQAVKKREQKLYPLRVRALLVNAIRQVSFSLNPKLPTRYDTKRTHLIIIAFGHDARGFSDDVKRNIMKQIGTDIDLSEVVWATDLSFSPRLLNKGWNCCIGNNAEWLLFAANGADTIKSEEFIIQKKEPESFNPTFFSKQELEKNRKDESLNDWLIIISGIVLFLIGLLILWSSH